MPTLAMAEPTHVDDDAPALGRESFVYQGRWEHVAGVADGRSNGTSSRSFSGFSAAALDFTGRTIRLYGVVGPTGGRAIVAIDGHVVDRDVSFHAPAKRVRHLIFSRSGLSPGRHRIAVVVVGTADSTGKRSFVNLDGAEYDS